MFTAVVHCWDELCEESPVPLSSVISEGRSNFIALSGNGYPLTLHPNSASGHLLKVSCSVESIAQGSVSSEFMGSIWFFDCVFKECTFVLCV